MIIKTLQEPWAPQDTAGSHDRAAAASGSAVPAPGAPVPAAPGTHAHGTGLGGGADAEAWRTVGAAPAALRQLCMLDAVAQCVQRGERPRLPSVDELCGTGLPSSCAAELLRLVADCWAHDMAARPSMHEVADRLQELREGVRNERKGAQQRQRQHQ